MSNLLKDDLSLLKSRLESIETQIEGQMKDLQTREEKWQKMEEQVKEIISKENEIVKLNVGGKRFATRTETLLKIKDTLFYKMILSKKFDLRDEIFFDRSPKIFPYLLDYLRYGTINYKRFSKDEMEELKVEAEYFEFGDILSYLEERMKEVEIVKMEFSGPYYYSNIIVGTNNHEDLKDRSMTKGICATTPGWITFELNNEWEFDEIEVGGYNGNATYWYNANGAGATIQTSNDKVNWKNVGTVPSNYGTQPVTVKLTKSSGKYLKFTHNSYLGLGFLNIKKGSSSS
jgi:hypothetical protein